MKQFYQLTRPLKNASYRFIQTKLVLTLALLLPFLSSAQAPIRVVGTPTYTQNFNSLNKTSTYNWKDNQNINDDTNHIIGLEGWYVQQGASTAARITASNGSVNAPGLLSLGSGEYGLDANDRSLASISAEASGKHVYVLRLINRTNQNVNRINVVFDLVQFWNNPGSNDFFGVSYQTGSTNDINSLITNKALNGGRENGWVPVNQKIKVPSIGRPGPKPGDRKTVTLDFTGFNLAVGQEILIRFEDAMNTKNFSYNAIGIDNISVTANPGNNTTSRIYHFVGKTTGNPNDRSDLTILSNWNTKKDRTGDIPSSFAADFQTFLIDVIDTGNGNSRPDTQTPTLYDNQKWVISGAGSKLILGDGNQDFRLTIPRSASYTGPIDLKGGSTLDIQNTNFNTATSQPNVYIDEVEENSTVNYSGAGSQVISEAAYFNLNISGSTNSPTASKYLFGNSSVSGTLGLISSNIFLSDFNLLVGDGANSPGNITRDQGYVVTTGNGALQRFVPAGTTALFPVGSTVDNALNGPRSYTPATIAQSGTADLLSVRVLDGYYESYTSGTFLPNGDRESQGVVERSWIVEEEVDGGSNINLNLGWPQTAHGTQFIPNASKLLYFDISNADWAEIGNSTYASANGHQVTGAVTTLGVFGVGNGGVNTPLPVELVSFRAARVKGEVELKWQTAMEKNNDYFTLEQSTNGKSFSEVTRVKGAGNSNQQKNYSYLHRNAPAEATYYRLKQTDIDGTFTYSKVVSVNGTANAGALAVYPNPSTGVYTLSGLTNVTEALVVDATGRTVKKINNLYKETGLVVNLADQKPGVYFLRLTSPVQSQTLRLIKQ